VFKKGYRFCSVGIMKTEKKRRHVLVLMVVDAGG